jgi:hypothetical protein
VLHRPRLVRRIGQSFKQVARAYHVGAVDGVNVAVCDKRDCRQVSHNVGVHFINNFAQSLSVQQVAHIKLMITWLCPRLKPRYAIPLLLQ